MAFAKSCQRGHTTVELPGDDDTPTPERALTTMADRGRPLIACRWSQSLLLRLG